jgi:Phasin protein
MNTYEIFEQWTGGQSDAFAPFLELNKVAAETFESVARRNYELAGDYFDLGLSQMKVLTAAKDVGQFSAEESRLAKEFADKFKAHTEAYLRIAADAGEAYSAWTATLSDTARQVVTPKSATKSAKKA